MKNVPQEKMTAVLSQMAQALASAADVIATMTAGEAVQVSPSVTPRATRETKKQVEKPERGRGPGIKRTVENFHAVPDTVAVILGNMLPRKFISVSDIAERSGFGNDTVARYIANELLDKGLVEHSYKSGVNRYRRTQKANTMASPAKLAVVQ